MSKTPISRNDSPANSEVVRKPCLSHPNRGGGTTKDAFRNWLNLLH
jgi:hypothetical protein